MSIYKTRIYFKLSITSLQLSNNYAHLSIGLGWIKVVQQLSCKTFVTFC